MTTSPATPAPPIFLRVKDVGDLVGLSRPHVYELLRKRGIKLEELWDGGPRRVRYSALLASFGEVPVSAQEVS